MPQELRSRETGAKKVETFISPATKAKWIKYCKKANISQAQVLRDYIQATVKRIK
jgi:hypothetical protein